MQEWRDSDSRRFFFVPGRGLLRLGAAALLCSVLLAPSPMRGALPSPWQTQDIGAVGAAGSADSAAGTYTVTGSGADIWDVNDEFRFVYQTISGDCTLTTRVDSVQNTNAWSKAGLMVRDSLAANAINAFTAVSPGNGVTFQYRTATGGISAYKSVAGIAAPYWVRLARYGTNLTGYRSANGTDWRVTSTTTLSMAAQVYVGLAVTSHSDGALCTSGFSNVTVAAGAAPPPAAPTGLTAQNVNGQIVLSWSAVTEATSYKVKRAISGSFSTIATVNTPGYTDATVTVGATYSYVVSAVTPAGESLDSAQVDVALPLAPKAPVDGKLDASVFTGPVAVAAPDIFSNRAQVAALGTLRVLTVEERVGERRVNELVRVPLFFHADECSNPQAFIIVPAEGGGAIPYQVDDVRKDSSGKIVRMTAYFYIDVLEPWKQRQFLLKPGTNPGASMAALPITTQSDKVTLQGGDIRVTFFSKGTKGGAIAGIEPTGGTVTLPQGYIGPKFTLEGQDSALTVIRQNPITYDDAQTIEIRDLRWASGPLFAKLTVRVGSGGQPDNAEFTYVVPAKGNYFSQVEKIFHDDPTSAETSAVVSNKVLNGQITVGSGNQSILRVPVGLRERLRSTFPGFNDALVGSGLAMLPISYTVPGYRGIQGTPGSTLAFAGNDSFIRKSDGNSSGLKVFWGQVDYHYTAATAEIDLWHEARRGFQTLTAVVDEPWATKALLYTKMDTVAARFSTIQYWNPSWRQKTFIAYLRDQFSTVQSLLSSNSTNTASAGTDPYDITYGASGYVLASEIYRPTDTNFHQKALNDATTSRTANAVVDPYNFPRINSFAYATNMQMGTYLLGMYGGQRKNNQSMVAWCRDSMGNQAMKGIYGRGQRSYGLEVKAVEQTDVLYECATDDYFRAIEVVSDEDLSIPPAVYGRYVDSIDVNSDIYQRAPATQNTAAQPYGYDRAMMFRAQTSDHRWETWTAGTVPYLELMAPTSKGTVGLTEAIYFTHWMMGNWVNWSDCGPLFVAFSTIRDLAAGHEAPPLAPLPAAVTVTRPDSSNVVNWTPVAGTVAGYRVYRAAQAGGPWTWLNSPYTTTPGKLVTGTTYTDAAGSVGSVYLVTAEDRNGRESDWFPEEPAPTATGAVPPPKTPTALAVTTSGTTINLAWNPGSYAAGYNIKRATSAGGPYSTIASGIAGQTFADAGRISGTTYYYTVSAFVGGLESANTAQVAAVAGTAPTWLSADVGSVGAAGSLAVSGSKFTVNGSGADVGGAADACRFAYRIVSGDFILTARVLSVQNTDPAAKAGVMIRGSLAANSINAFTAVTAANGLVAQRRTTAGGPTSTATVSAIAAPEWVRLKRTGSTLVSSRSADGVTWVTVDSQNVQMPTQVYAGMAVTSHLDGTLCAAEFDNVVVDTSTQAPPSAPFGLTAAQTGNGAIALAWNAVSGATSYRVKRSTVNGGPYSSLFDVTSPGCGDTGLINGSTYYYVVSAIGAGGEGANSAAAPITLAVPLVSAAELDAPQINLSPAAVSVTVAMSVTGRSYQLQSTTTLAAGDWVDVGAAQAGTGAALQFVVPVDPSASARFYRVLLQ